MVKFWDYNILNNTVRDWFIAIGIIVFAIIFLRVVQHIAIRKIKSYTLRTKTRIDDFIIATIQSSVMPLLYFLAFYFGLQYLDISAKAASVGHVAIIVVVTFFVLRTISHFIAFLFSEVIDKDNGSDQGKKRFKGIVLITNIIVWLVGALFVVDNLGYDITTIVAGLGIGGIAIALAAQTILGDLFNYFVILFDKPFEIDDFIIVDDKMGTVERIGIKTTRVRSLGGEQLIFSNTNLTSSRMHNYKRMQERRVVFSFGIIYGTTARKLREIPQYVKMILDAIPGVRFDRAHFQSFGDFSLNFEVVYYVLTADYNIYMDKQQMINLEICDLFEKESIEFAFPTQSLYISNMAEKEQVVS